MDRAEIALEPFYKALVCGNTMECRRITQYTLSREKDLTPVYENLFKPVLYKVGREWEYHRISVAVEHMATALIESLMNEIFSDFIAPRRNNKGVVLASVQNEEHQVGCRMVADTFEKSGWNSYFLGANTPVKDLVEFCKNVNPDAIGLSLSVYFNVDVFMDELEAIRKATDLPILIGGQGLGKSGPLLASKFDNVLFLRDIFQVEEYLKELS